MGLDHHYGILARVKRADGETEADFQYNQRRQEHHIEDLMKYGIQIVLVDDYSEITDMLKQIRCLINAKSVFISGSFEVDDNANSYGKYAREIVKWLIENGYTVHTGYGKNVGAEVVAGAFSACGLAKSKIKSFNGSVFLYPFPYMKSMPDEERKALYTEIRTNMILKTHFTIIINGTKKPTKDSPVIVANGVIDEGHLSIEHGNVVIPIAVTGGAAQQIWQEIHDSNNEYSKTSEFRALSTGDTFSVVFEAVQRIVKNG